MRWRSRQGKCLYGARPTPGQIIAYEYRPWRVLEVASIDPTTTPEERQRADREAYIITLRPAALTTLASHHDEDISLRVPGRYFLDVLPEHYALCVLCQDLPPCRHDVQNKITASAMAQFARYEQEGVCPACEEVITARQQKVAFPVNIKIPGGPPVVFHRRQQCFWSAVGYDREWADQEGRPALLSCQGMLASHGPGRGHCDEAACPGPEVAHRSWYACACSADLGDVLPGVASS